MSGLRISEPITLKCGLTLPNRLVKAAMTEQVVDKNDGLPNEMLNRVYSAWALGGWGMVLTGNVQVDGRWLGAPYDTAINDDVSEGRLQQSWKQWSSRCNANDTPTIVQLNHPGRQSPLGAGSGGVFTKNLAPSTVPMQLAGGLLGKIVSCVAFGVPKEMDIIEIEDAVQRFVRGATLAYQAGFAGVQIHAAHGYLLAQFLSAKVNKRTDDYGGTPIKRAKIVLDIIRAIREVVPPGFCVGIKLNSVDHQSPHELAECIEQLKAITDLGVDFLEISGGTYENPTVRISFDVKP
jgi:2,4-dienoyl-CoA reductase-like NADH-dependent reductase (Old Yellow Enzyme family)